MTSLAELYAHLKTLTSQWHYLKTEIDTALGGKVDKVTGKTLTSNDFTNTLKTKLDNIEAEANKTIVDSSLSNSSANPVQNQVINSALSGLDSRITALEGIDAIQVVQTLPTASASTMNRLYIINESSNVNVYYTEENNGSYAWHKMDTDILDDLSIEWADIQNKPSSFTPSSHTHGNISNDGKVTTTGTNNGSMLVTTSSDVVVAQTVVDVFDGVVQNLISYGE